MINDIKLKPQDYYIGLEGVKGVNTDHLMTDEMIQEYIKCSKDCQYFIENYMWITNPDGDEFLFKLYPYQKEFIKMLNTNRLNIILAARQAGKSQCIIGWLLWKLLFNRNFKIKYLGNTSAIASEMIERIKFSYQKLPLWLQKAVINFNTRKLKLENNSEISCQGTTKNSSRGSSNSIIVLDEFAFVDRNIQNDFMASTFPTITKGKNTQLVIISTPNGKEKFYEIYTNAEENKNQFAHIKITWDMVPDRDEKWKEMTIGMIGLQKFRIEHECCFEGSGKSAVKAYLLAKIKPENPINIEYISDNNPECTFKTYEFPEENSNYHIQVDPSTGAGQDYTVFNVFKIDNYKAKQVAVWKANDIVTDITAMKLYHLGLLYNNATISIEVTGIGQSISDKMWDEYEYENILSTKTEKGRPIIYRGFELGSRKGIYTTNSIKLNGVEYLNNMLEKEILTLVDEDTKKQLEVFNKHNNTYKADEGSHDDLSMTCVLFAWLFNKYDFTEENRSEENSSIFSITPVIKQKENTSYVSFEDWIRN